jgi:uncharacterized DUF497 family protein
MPTPQAETGTFRTTYIYKVNNPHTGAVEFPEQPFRLYAWVGYALDHNGRSRVIGYSNDPDEATAVKHISRNTLSGTDVRVVPARPANARERDAYLARRAQLAPTDAKRARWAKRLTDAAVDYARTDRDDPDSAIAEAHLADLVGRALRDLGDKWEADRMHVDWARRITTRAGNAARWFLIAERDLDNHARAEALDYRITGCLKQRDALIAALEAVTKY